MMSLIHRSTLRISNKLALIAAVMLVFSSVASLTGSSDSRDATETAGTQQIVDEQATANTERTTSKVNVSLLLFGRG